MAQRTAEAHAEAVRDMLARGDVLGALRHARRYRVESVPPVYFMDCAVQSGDPCVLATAYRFCADHVPEFSKTPEHAHYAARLALRR